MFDMVEVEVRDVAPYSVVEWRGRLVRVCPTTIRARKHTEVFQPSKGCVYLTDPSGRRVPELVFLDTIVKAYPSQVLQPWKG